nr:hypothetical protein [Tanacetum cinerariifolium]
MATSKKIVYAPQVESDLIVEVLSGNKSSTDQLNLSQHMIVYTLLTRAMIDIGEIIFNDLVSRLTEKPRKKYVAYPRFLSCVLESLLGSNYNQSAALRSTPSVLSKLNFHRNSSEVPLIELTEHMLSVVSYQALVSPTLSLERVGKKKKSKTVTKPKPKSKGLQAFRVPPEETKGKKQAKTKQTQREIQPTDMGSPLPEGTNHDPKDSEGNKELADMGLPFTPKDGIHISQLLPKGKPTDAEDPKRNKQLTGKTSSEVKSDIQAPIQSFQDFEILMEDSEDDLKELSDEEYFKDEDEMEDAFPLNTKEA